MSIWSSNTATATWRRHVKYGLLTSVKQFGAVGDGATDDTAAIQAAIDSGDHCIYIPPGTYMISSRLDITDDNTKIVGASQDLSIIKATASNSISSGMILLQTAGTDGVWIEGIQLDGDSDNNTGGDYTGIYGTVVTNLTIKDCFIQNTIKNGIQLAATTTANTGFLIQGNRLENIGWRGIDIFYGEKGQILDNYLYKCGSAGIMTDSGTTKETHNCKNITIRGNYVDKSSAPSTIYNSNSEDGFMIGIGPVAQNFIVDGNICWDNSNTAFDGIGIGERLGHPHNRVLITNNIVYYAGLYGIDATNASVVSGNYVSNPDRHGIVIAADLGEDVNFCHIHDNIIINANEANSGTDTAGIAAFSLVSGATFNNINIHDNTVFDGRGTKQTDYGIILADDANLTFGAQIKVNNNDLEHVLTNGMNASGLAISNLRCRGNQNIKTENSGTVTFDNAVTSDVVTHGLDITPLLQDIRITATTTQAAALGYWVSNVGATTFTINTTANSGTTTSFSWEATAARP